MRSQQIEKELFRLKLLGCKHQLLPYILAVPVTLHLEPYLPLHWVYTFPLHLVNHLFFHLGLPSPCSIKSD